MWSVNSGREGMVDGRSMTVPSIQARGLIDFVDFVSSDSIIATVKYRIGCVRIFLISLKSTEM